MHMFFLQYIIFLVKYIPTVYFFLIAEAVARILGTSEKIIKSGSALKLHCILRQSTEEPQYIFWYV